MAKEELFDRVVSVLVLLVAIASLSLIGLRYFSGPPPAAPTGNSATRVESWKSRSGGAVRTLSTHGSGRVVVTVFTDFQCPFCRRMDSLLTDYSRSKPGLLALQIVHLPLPMHANAKGAAHAFECALRQGQPDTFASALYAQQSEFGSVSWDSLAGISGIRSVDKFRECMRSPMPTEVSAGLQLAKDLGISVTPTVVVDDWLIRPAEPEYVFRSIEAVAAGRKPKP